MNEPARSVSYWLGQCEAVSEQIAELLDAERHRPGKFVDLFRKRQPTQDDVKLAAALQDAHTKLQRAFGVLGAAVPGWRR